MSFFGFVAKAAVKAASKTQTARRVGAAAVRQGKNGFAAKAFAQAGRAARKK